MNAEPTMRLPAGPAGSLRDQQFLHMYEQGCGTDVSVAVEGLQGRLHAHSFILRSRTPVLEAAWRQDMQEARSGQVRLLGGCPSLQVADVFLRFLYTGLLSCAGELTWTEALSLWRLADYYILSDLRAALEEPAVLQAMSALATTKMMRFRVVTTDGIVKIENTPAKDLTLRSILRVMLEASDTGLILSRELAEACWQVALSSRPLEALCIASHTKNKHLQQLCMKEYFAGCLQLELASFLPAHECLPSDRHLEEAAENCVRYIGSLFGACKDPYGEIGGRLDAVRIFRSCGASAMLQAHAHLFQVTASLIRSTLEVHTSRWSGSEAAVEEMSYVERTSKMQDLLFRALPDATERLVAALAALEGHDCCDKCCRVVGAAAGRSDPDHNDDVWYCTACWEQQYDSFEDPAPASQDEAPTSQYEDLTDLTEEEATEEERDGPSGEVQRRLRARAQQKGAFRVDSLD